MAQANGFPDLVRRLQAQSQPTQSRSALAIKKRTAKDGALRK